MFPSKIHSWVPLIPMVNRYGVFRVLDQCNRTSNPRAPIGASPFRSQCLCNCLESRYSPSAIIPIGAPGGTAWRPRTPRQPWAAKNRWADPQTRRVNRLRLGAEQKYRGFALTRSVQNSSRVVKRPPFRQNFSKAVAQLTK